MALNRLLTTGIVGFSQSLARPEVPEPNGQPCTILSMLGCVTLAHVALLAALGIAESMGWLDYVLLPAMAVFAALTVYAIVAHRRRGLSS
jgi:mercuric ion transport protein